MAGVTEPKEVKLHGAWGSAHSAMARNALALKGVRYEYVEEDLDNKSETLLRLNPVHGKVPVLVVDGRPLSESLVIIEYVDGAWHGREPALLPREPRERAAARFWARFFHDRVSPLSHPVVFAAGEAERAELVREMKERMAVLEAGIREDFPYGSEGPFVHGRRPGLLDVILGSCAAGIRLLSALSGEEIVEPGTLPRVHASVTAFDELANGFRTTVPHELLLARLLERKARPRAAAA
ncbi:glutathione S-transferase U10-like [Phragmites australis]|uniref:glutathione S-transferase U10-like n=1 Tax=Phragmites australis TaxID=29695 RepID=UPI002D78B9BD|nr:glutathione S-transferase U10-like [Phragmites australis]